MKKRDSEEKLEELLVEFTESLTGGTSAELGSLPEEIGDALPLFDTVQAISSVLKPEQPSEEFAARLSHAVQERFQAQRKKSAQKIRTIIARAVTDEDFRTSFFRDVVVACRSIGFELNAQEVAALRNLKEDAVKEFANSLDERITKFFPANLL